MTYRILTLDGGGSWALIEVHALIRIYGENARGHDVLKDFDMVAANSGGSLVLAGLVENLGLNQILQYFLDEQKRRALFSPTSSVVDRILSGLLKIGPKYSAAAKLPAIRSLLPETGDLRIEGIAKDIPGPRQKPVHLLIVGFDYDVNRAVFFRSAPARRPGWGDGQPSKASLASAVHASTNAPVNYFDAPATCPEAPGRRFWDGGITGCNNPAAAAVVEAIVLGQNPSEICVLSLGTASVSLPLPPPGAPAGPLEAPREESNVLNDLKKLATAILDDPPDAATFIAHAITGADLKPEDPVKSRVVRMSPLISPLPAPGGGLKPPAQWSVDQFKYLCGVGMDAVDALQVTYVQDYCLAWLDDQAPNQPIRPSGATFDPMHPELGQPLFSEALKAWRKLTAAPALVADAGEPGGLA
ncbi:patatin-like phospholipase family protein [Methylocystis sp. JAN1]|uniref:patatin-like phospholipase family protein n=1 Tax=Methylocystis sp. JAN1 TaxID=3397211 RepID=UPI003FA1F44A